MRRYIGALLCAACVMVVAPGVAVTEPLDRPETIAALTLQRGHLPHVSLSDELTIILVGTALIGVAALVRRAS
jgi:hypothetical protein